MTYDVPQWLLRVQRLQHELEQTRLERDSARAGEASWRQRYQAELRQYQTETEQVRQRIAVLEAQQLQFAKEVLSSIDLLALKVDLEQCQSIEGLKAALAVLRPSQVSPSLQAEKATCELHSAVVSSGGSFPDSPSVVSSPQDAGMNSAKLEAV